MKNFLVNLLIVISLSLCALISFQWHRAWQARQQVQKLTDSVHDRDERLQTLEGDVKRYQGEVVRLDKLKNELTETVKSNKLDAGRLAKDLERVTQESDRQTKQVDAYKDALQRANEAIQKQNDDVKRQNEDMKKLAEERNELVQKHNKAVSEFNDLAAKWNQLQETLSRNATNAPAGK